MFDLHDRLWVYLLGLRQVQARLVGEDVGFFYTAQSGAQTLFCTLPNLELPFAQPRYRFYLPTGAQTSPTFCQSVKGWPGWMQAVNPQGEDEETLWQCVTRAYLWAAQTELRQSVVLQGGSYVAQSL